MKNLSMIVLAVSLGVLAPAVASAQVLNDAIEEKKLDSGKQKLSTDKGYIFLHGSMRSSLLLIKQPTSDEMAVFEEERQAELAEALKKYPKKLESWQRDAAFWRRAEKPDRIPPKPVAPDSATFSIGPIELRYLVSVGPGDPFAKAEDYFSYLHELEPGTYRYYGPILAAPNGVMAGVCACMGSVQFEVKAGTITNLGDLLSGGLAKVTDFPDALDVNRVAGPVNYSLPQRLASFPNEQADWRASGKIDNFYALMVGRMPPVPGVLAYERDRIIDVKATGAGAAGAP